MELLDSEARRAATMVAQRGHAYEYDSGRIITLRVFSTSEADVRLLKRVYGGNYYQKPNGFQWSLSARRKLSEVRQSIEPLRPAGANRRLGPLLNLPAATERRLDAVLA